TNESGTIVTNEIVCWGSNPVTGSLMKVSRSVPPRFGVWALAVSGARRLAPPARPATAAAPPALRRSRRGREGGTGGWGVGCASSAATPEGPRAESGHVGWLDRALAIQWMSPGPGPHHRPRYCSGGGGAVKARSRTAAGSGKRPERPQEGRP